MTEELYIVSYSWYEEYSPTLLRGPKVDDWEAYCKGFMDQAAERAMSEYKGPIAWDEIKRILVDILLEQGYKTVHPPRMEIWGTCFIDDMKEDKDELLSKDVLAKIVARGVDHKREMRERHMKRKAEKDQEDV